MFWKKKPKKAQTKRDKAIAEAQSVLAAKREEIGDDALDQIRRAITKHESSLTTQAKKEIRAADIGKVTDNIKFMMSERTD